MPDSNMTAPMAPPRHPKDAPPGVAPDTAPPNADAPAAPPGFAYSPDGINHNSPLVKGAVAAYDYGKGAVNTVKGWLTPAHADTSMATDEQGRAQGLAGAFQADRQGVVSGGGTQLDQSYIDPLRQRQNTQLDSLTAAANGTAPSQAEILGNQMAARAAGQQFGIASAMQGRSAGGAMGNAQRGAADITGAQTINAMGARAGEMATARGQLTDALNQTRAQEQNLSTGNATLNVDQQKMLLAAQLQEEGYSADMVKAIIDSKTKDAAATNAYKGSLIGGGGAILAAL